LRYINYCRDSGKKHIDFKLAENHYGVTEHEKKLTKDRSRLDTRKYFFNQRVVNGWNSLPAEVVKCRVRLQFQERLRPFTHPAKIWTTEADQSLPVHQPTRLQIQVQVVLLSRFFHPDQTSSPLVIFPTN